MTNEEMRERVRSIEEDGEKLERRLYGNGQPGDIQQIRSEVKKIDESVRVLQIDNRRLIWIMAGVVIAINVLTGTGLVTAKTLLEMFRK